MNHLSCFVLVITLIMCIELSNGKSLLKDSVHFKNSLRPNNYLKIHCKSDEDDLGVHFLSNGQTYDFSFYESILKTKVNCVLWKGPGFILRSAFRAYKGGGLIVHYGKKNFWDVREDGIYFTHGQDLPKLEYKWSNNQALAPSY
ncbi:unnamed protein product [Cochlearia groenlandica]